MNLLVTNTDVPQAYAVVRALRPHAQKIVAIMYGPSLLRARLSHVAHSRLVDARHMVPSPVKDWLEGTITPQNSSREEAYVQAVEDICREEMIDTIFPIWDPEIYVLSKNKKRFEEMGVLIMVPDHQIALNLLDKHRTIAAAEEVGFPCSKTLLVNSEVDLQKAAEVFGFPLVVKPRFSSGGHGMVTVTNAQELHKARPAVVHPGRFIVQELIPGVKRLNFNLLLGREGELKYTFSKTIVRNLRMRSKSSTYSLTAAPHPYIDDAARFARGLGWSPPSIPTLPLPSHCHSLPRQLPLLTAATATRAASTRWRIFPSCWRSERPTPRSLRIARLIHCGWIPRG